MYVIKCGDKFVQSSRFSTERYTSKECWRAEFALLHSAIDFKRSGEKIYEVETKIMYTEVLPKYYNAKVGGKYIDYYENTKQLAVNRHDSESLSPMRFAHPSIPFWSDHLKIEWEPHYD